MGNINSNDNYGLLYESQDYNPDTGVIEESSIIYIPKIEMMVQYPKFTRITSAEEAYILDNMQIDDICIAPIRSKRIELSSEFIKNVQELNKLNKEVNDKKYRVMHELKNY